MVLLLTTPSVPKYCRRWLFCKKVFQLFFPQPSLHTCRRHASQLLTLRWSLSALPSPRRRAPLHFAALPSPQIFPPVAASLLFPPPLRAPVAEPPKLCFLGPVADQGSIFVQSGTNRRFRRVQGRILWLEGCSGKESSWNARNSRQRARLSRRRPPPAAVQFAASGLPRACTATPSPSR